MSVALLHESPWQGVISVTGGGSAMLSILLTKAGASNTVLEATVPYSATALANALGSAPESACSGATSRALAVSAFHRAVELQAESRHAFGFAITAALQTYRRRRGSDRAFVALQTDRATWEWELALSDRTVRRFEQEDQVTTFAVERLCETLLELPSTQPTPCRHSESSAALKELFLGNVAALGPPASAFLPGAFNPLHNAHTRMREQAESQLGEAVVYELCIRNIDKPPLDYIEIDGRLNALDNAPVVLTNTPDFQAKIEALKPDGSCTFVVGVDTLQRVIDPQYYALGSVGRDEALTEFIARGTRFLCFPRLLGSEFTTVTELDVPSDFLAECVIQPTTEFRMDVSSTALRRAKTSRTR